MFSPLLQQLIEALRYLPGVGPKTAQRMAFYLLEHGRHQGLQLSEILSKAIHDIKHCARCRNFSETEICHLCSSLHRDITLLCIVEHPIDVLAIEQTASYRGFYFVLQGHLSPLDGIGPADIGIDILKIRLEEPGLQEVILATNPTVEGQATAHYLAELIKTYHIKVSRIAHGVPLGGELEFIDGGTITHALLGRELLK